MHFKTINLLKSRVDRVDATSPLPTYPVPVSVSTSLLFSHFRILAFLSLFLRVEEQVPFYYRPTVHLLISTIACRTEILLSFRYNWAISTNIGDLEHQQDICTQLVFLRCGFGTRVGSFSAHSIFEVVRVKGVTDYGDVVNIQKVHTDNR